MRSTEKVSFSGISANTAAFTLTGGSYQLAVVATFGGGNVGVSVLGPDGTTYLASHTALTANGIINFDAPAGQYRISITTATAVSCSVVRIPGE